MKHYTYHAHQSAAFRRTRESWGGFSNMASGYPITIGCTHVRTVEALFQALKFPHHPDVQAAIIAERSPMEAKRVSRQHDSHCRPDWLQIRIKVMYWCLQMKLAQNFIPFSELLNASVSMHIVENSSRDDFWGAKPHADQFTGQNVLGRLLMRLRKQLQETADPNTMQRVESLNITDCLFLGNPLPSFPAQQDAPSNLSHHR